jgi:antitoxin VapB
MDTAKVFWTGRSQAVRLPKEFRLAGEEVRIRRHGAAIILEPLPRDWAWLEALSGKLDPDAGAAALEEPTDQDRPGLDKLFPS